MSDQSLTASFAELISSVGAFREDVAQLRSDVRELSTSVTEIRVDLATAKAANVNLQRLDDKIDKLEAWKNNMIGRMLGIAIGSSLAGGGSVAAILQFLGAN